MESEFISKWKSQLKKGTLPFVVILLLKKKELYGYGLIEKMKGSTGIQIAEGTLYPLLNRLKAEGLLDSKWIEQGSGLPRKYYFLTNKGEFILNQMKSHWSELFKGLENI